MAEPAKRPLWGWTRKARMLLTIVAGLGAAGLVLRAPAAPRQPAAAIPPLVLDINTAPPAALEALPRLGPSLVSRIVAARTAAPFRSLEELDARVQGIGPATMTALRPHLCVGPGAR